MAIKRQHKINPARQIPLLGYISKGVMLANSPIDTDRFWVNFNPKFFNRHEVYHLRLLWDRYHEIDPFPVNSAQKEDWQGLWINHGGKEGTTSEQAKRSILTSGEFPDGNLHNFAPERLNHLTLITDDYQDESSYEAWLEWRTKTKADKMQLLIRCDLEKQVLRLNKETWRVESSDIPCQREAKENPCKCKPSIHLRLVYWPFLKYANIPFGYFVVQSGSWYDDSSISPALGFIKQNYSEPFNISMSRIPLTLWREKKKHSYTDGTERRSRTDAVICLSATAEFVFAMTDKLNENYVREAPQLDPNAAATVIFSPKSMALASNDEQFSELGSAAAWLAGIQSRTNRIDKRSAPVIPSEMQDEDWDNLLSEADELDDGFYGGGDEEIDESDLGDELQQEPDIAAFGELPANEGGKATKPPIKQDPVIGLREAYFQRTFGGSVTECLEYWAETYPDVKFPAAELILNPENKTWFSLAKALSEAQIPIPIHTLWREDKETTGYIGSDGIRVRYHIRTVEAFRGLIPDGMLEELRVNGEHRFPFDDDNFDIPVGVLAMKTRKKEDTVYFDMTDIHLI